MPDEQVPLKLLENENWHLRAENERLRAAIKAVLDGNSYQTPAGTYNCRFCDRHLDDGGTGQDVHDAACVVHELRAALGPDQEEES